ncbi:MAG: hypothetical protein FWG84_03175 [Bacteroidales bacterium]|nr:hypothetical protein [Bacteroidales bacterium]
MTNNKFRWMICAMMCAAIFAGCGGNGGSKLKKNEYLGSLPGIYADYKAKTKAFKEKWEKKEANAKNMNQFAKLAAEYDKEEKELKGKFNADCEEEFKKITGKDIPLSFSKELLNSDALFYDVSATPLYINKQYSNMPCVNFSFTTKHDVEVPARKVGERDEMYAVYYRLIASDGSMVGYPSTVSGLIERDFKPKSITAGTPLVYKPWSEAEDIICYLFTGDKPETFVEFAGVEFITKSEYEEALAQMGK